VQELYGRADCLVFPSRLETWGMPISEFKQTGKPMLVADLPYGHETVGDYANASFFSPLDAENLAEAMQELIEGTFVPQAMAAVHVEPPFAEDWQQLFNLLLGGA
jgi:glycosyltransferase involved in cell wall biosynthesis